MVNRESAREKRCVCDDDDAEWAKKDCSVMMRMNSGFKYG